MSLDHESSIAVILKTPSKHNCSFADAKIPKDFLLKVNTNNYYKLIDRNHSKQWYDHNSDGITIYKDVNTDNYL